jgi:hypothetical protein
VKLDEDTAAIFLHIPKTAGTTMHRIIERQYSQESMVSFGFDAHQSILEFKALSRERRAQIRMLKGHMGFGLHRHLPNPAVYFTLMRDPIERVISHYYHILRDPDHYLYPHTQGGRLELADFLKTEVPLMLDNGQTRLVSGVWDKVPFGACDEEVLEIAKNNVDEHFALVGLTERFDETLCMLQDILGWSNDISYVRENVGRNRPYQDGWSSETLAAVVETNRLDMALYDYATRLFQEEVRRYGPSLAAQAERLKVRGRLEMLESRADVMMRDYEVSSNIPVIGRLIAWIRCNLTSHLREPYLDPTIERQVVFNQATAELMKEAVTSWSDSDRRQAELESRVEDLESQVEALTRRLGEVELPKEH